MTRSQARAMAATRSSQYCRILFVRFCCDDQPSQIAEAPGERSRQHEASPTLSHKQVFVPLAFARQWERGNWGESRGGSEQIVPLASISTRCLVIE